MPKVVAPLRDTKIAQAKPAASDYKMFDGGGLFLLVKTTGVKSWRLKYRKPDGREGLASLGAYPAVSLAQARELRADYVSKLASGVDPIAEKAKTKAAAVANHFKDVARLWWEAQKKWSSDHASRVWRRFELHLLPALGARPVAAIEPAEIVAALAPVESAGTHDVASRLRQYLVAVFRFAIQRGLLRYNPAGELTGVAVSVKPTHRPALLLEELPQLLQRIDAYPFRPTTRLGLLLTLHLFVRSSELRNARWSEFDLVSSLWTIPATREPIEGARFSERGAKMKTPHLVPLSPQVLALLADLKRHVGDGQLLLPGDHKDWIPMSEGTLGKALRALGYDTKTQLTPHGMRTMACSALNESGRFNRDAIERQMGHQERDGVRAAYIHKAEFLEERRRMMAWWSGYLEAVKKGGYVPPWEFKVFQ